MGDQPACFTVDPDLFCRRMIEAVERWYTIKAADPNVKKNLGKLVTYRRAMTVFINRELRVLS
jgi:hypothetical protein